MRPAVEMLVRLGADAIVEHERGLATRAAAGLENLPGLRLLGPTNPEHKTGIVSFVVDGIHSDQIGQWLNAAGIAIRVGHHCAMPLHARLGIGVSCRASFYIYNTEAEADAFVEAVAKAIR